MITTLMELNGHNVSSTMPPKRKSSNKKKGKQKGSNSGGGPKKQPATTNSPPAHNNTSTTNDDIAQDVDLSLTSSKPTISNECANSFASLFAADYPPQTTIRVYIRNELHKKEIPLADKAYEDCSDCFNRGMRSFIIWRRILDRRIVGGIWRRGPFWMRWRLL